MSRKHIYDPDPLYTFLRTFWTDCNIRPSYRRAEVHGLENIPKDKAIILSPNHCNTLMDALVVMNSFRGSTVFGARADIFKKPLVAKFMYFLRILPIVRQRDGLRNVLQNNETQDVIVETLDHGVRFCLFPEGTHRTKHSLQRLGKGIFRIALAAVEKFEGNKPVYIVPVGIEYGDYFRYHSTVLVNYGEAINVTEFLAKGNFDSEPHAIEALRGELSRRMSSIITYIPDDENYEAKWSLVKMRAIYKSRKGYGQRGLSLHDAMQKNREIAADIERALDKNPERMTEILKRAEDFETERRKAGISIYSFRKMKPLCNIIVKGLVALLGLPYFIFSAIVSLPLWAVAAKIRKSVKDPAFRNTVSFGVRLVLDFIIFVIYAVLAFCLTPWWLALAILILYIPSYSYFHDYIEGCRRWFSDIKLFRNKKLYKDFKDIVKDFISINKGIDKLNKVR